MRILIVLKQKKNLDAFAGTVRELLARGHEVRVGVQEHDADRHVALWISDLPGFSVVPCPAARHDDWAAPASLLRSLRDGVRYLRPGFRDAHKLRARAFQKLRQVLPLPAETPWHEAATHLTPDYVERLDAILGLAEAALPNDRAYEEFLEANAPDLLLLSPVVHFGSAQADMVRSARKLRIPVGMLLYSWDNLSTKGCLHAQPDWMFVWNERQRREASELHGFSAERVIVTGAPRFDEFFAASPATGREEFLNPLGLDPSAPTLLYLCSSRFVSEQELPVIRRWLTRVRSSDATRLRSANVIVRPHPDIALNPSGIETTAIRWPQLREATGSLQRPFDDDRAVVLWTANEQQQCFYDCLAHSTAVVGLNTSGELEAGIAGRPVFTFVVDDEEVTGQSSTLHFHYLLAEHGGFVTAARGLDMHVRQLAEMFERSAAAARRTAGDTPEGAAEDSGRIRAFIAEFLRPHGIDRPVAAVLAGAIEDVARGAAGSPQEAPAVVAAESPTWTPARPAGAKTPSGGGSPLPVQYDACRVWVYRTPETRRPARKGVYRVDPATVEWLEHSVGPGDVVYDVRAGIGVYSMIAAKRGALVVAVEAGYSTYGRLCENLLLNGCDGSVFPVCVALWERDGVGELKYRQHRPGREHYGVRQGRWRGRLPATVGAYVQPTCLMRLETLVDAHDLPAPTHLRIASAPECLRIIRGGGGALRGRLKSLLIDLQVSDRDAILSRLADAGFGEGQTIALHHGMQRLLLKRDLAARESQPTQGIAGSDQRS